MRKSGETKPRDHQGPAKNDKQTKPSARRGIKRMMGFGEGDVERNSGIAEAVGCWLLAELAAAGISHCSRGQTIPNRAKTGPLWQMPLLGEGGGFPREGHGGGLSQPGWSRRRRRQTRLFSACKGGKTLGTTAEPPPSQRPSVHSSVLFLPLASLLPTADRWRIAEARTPRRLKTLSLSKDISFSKEPAARPVERVADGPRACLPPESTKLFVVRLAGC